MTIIANYLIPIVACLGGLSLYLWGRSIRRIVTITLITGFIIFCLMATNPIMSKTKVYRAEVPDFEKTEAVIEDRNRKPERTIDERNQFIDEKLDAVRRARETQK